MYRIAPLFLCVLATSASAGAKQDVLRLTKQTFEMTERADPALVDLLAEDVVIEVSSVIAGQTFASKMSKAEFAATYTAETASERPLELQDLVVSKEGKTWRVKGTAFDSAYCFGSSFSLDWAKRDGEWKIVRDVLAVPEVRGCKGTLARDLYDYGAELQSQTPVVIGEGIMLAFAASFQEYLLLTLGLAELPPEGADHEGFASALVCTIPELNDFNRRGVGMEVTTVGPSGQEIATVRVYANTCPVPGSEPMPNPEETPG